MTAKIVAGGVLSIDGVEVGRVESSAFTEAEATSYKRCDGSVAFAAVCFQMTISAEAIAKLQEGLRRAHDSVMAFSKLRARERRDLYRGDWWKRDEGPPDWIADVAEAEWWNSGEEPPPWGCAA